MGPPTFDLSHALSFQTLATPAGAAIAGFVIRFVIEWLKLVAPVLMRYLPGASWAGVGALLLYTVTALVVQPGTADGWLNLVWTMVLASMAAIGLNEVLQMATNRNGGDTAAGRIEKAVADPSQPLIG